MKMGDPVFYVARNCRSDDRRDPGVGARNRVCPAYLQPHLLPACMLVPATVACMRAAAGGRTPLVRETAHRLWYRRRSRIDAVPRPPLARPPRSSRRAAPALLGSALASADERSHTHHSAAPPGLSVPRRHAVLSFRSRVPSVRERYISANPSRPCI